MNITRVTQQSDKKATLQIFKRILNYKADKEMLRRLFDWDEYVDTSNRVNE